MLITFEINIVSSQTCVLNLPQQRTFPSIIHAFDLLFILAQLLISSLFRRLSLFIDPVWHGSVDSRSHISIISYLAAANNNEWLGRPGLPTAWSLPGNHLFVWDICMNDNHNHECQLTNQLPVTRGGAQSCPITAKYLHHLWTGLVVYWIHYLQIFRWEVRGVPRSFL